MAAGGTEKDLNDSVLAGSDEVFDFYCQPCSIDNLHLEAIGFCSDCEEYLCKTCYRCHRRSTASKNHTLLDKSSMPKTTPTLKVKDQLTEKCSTHPDKVIEYFCNTHNDLCCSVCLNMSHITCSKSYIPKVSDGIAGSPEYRKLRGDLDKFISMVTGHQMKIKTDTQNNKKYHSNALKDIKQFRTEMNELLDKLEDDVVRKVSQLNDDNMKKLRQMSAKCQPLLLDLNALVVNLEENANDGKNSNLFVGVKKTRVSLSAMENRFQEIRQHKASKYIFALDEKLQEMQEMRSTLSTLWSLLVRQEAVDTSARYIQDVNMKSADDTKHCNITGIAVLTGDRIVLTDFDNKSVKLVDVKQNKVKCRVSMSSVPLDITAVKEDQVAVALGNEEKLEIFTVSNTLSLTRTIKVPGARMAGLQYDGQRFLTVCQYPDTVKIIDMSGKVLSTFSTDSNGKPLFTMPRYIALSRDHNVLYVTDIQKNTVTYMTVGGKVISVYKHDKLKYPVGVAVDTDGSVYVCSSDTHTIHQLTPTGTLIQILLGQENGLAERPRVIAHGDKDGKLYISSNSFSPDGKNHVKVFQIQR